MCEYVCVGGKGGVGGAEEGGGQKPNLGKDVCVCVCVCGWVAKGVWVVRKREGGTVRGLVCEVWGGTVGGWVGIEGKDLEKTNA